MRKLNEYDYEALESLLERYCEKLIKEDRLATVDLVIYLKNIISFDKENIH